MNAQPQSTISKSYHVIQLPVLKKDSIKIGSMVFWDEKMKVATNIGTNNEFIGYAYKTSNKKDKACEVLLSRWEYDNI